MGCVAASRPSRRSFTGPGAHWFVTMKGGWVLSLVAQGGAQHATGLCVFAINARSSSPCGLFPRRHENRRCRTRKHAGVRRRRERNRHHHHLRRGHCRVALDVERALYDEDGVARRLGLRHPGRVVRLFAPVRNARYLSVPLHSSSGVRDDRYRGGHARRAHGDDHDDAAPAGMHRHGGCGARAGRSRSGVRLPRRVAAPFVREVRSQGDEALREDRDPSSRMRRERQALCRAIDLRTVRRRSVLPNDRTWGSDVQHQAKRGRVQGPESRHCMCW